ncbi:MAG: helix-turn-helix domain-containing protein [Vicinamibacterales bacterium]
MDVREALLEAALKVFAEAGMRGATTRKIAQAADVNEVTLFRHFRSKDELIEAALAGFAQRVETRVLPPTPTDPRSELIAWCGFHHRELHKRSALIRKAMGEHEEHPSHCAQGMRASVRVARELTEYLRRLKQAGLATGDWDEAAATNMLMGALFADALGRDTMPDRYPYSMRAAVQHYVDLLLNAIGAGDVSPASRGRTSR